MVQVYANGKYWYTYTHGKLREFNLLLLDKSARLTTAQKHVVGSLDANLLADEACAQLLNCAATDAPQLWRSMLAAFQQV